MIALRISMCADAVSLPPEEDAVVVRGCRDVESVHSSRQQSPKVSQILCKTTQDETTWGTFSSMKSSLFKRQRHRPFS